MGKAPRIRPDDGVPHLFEDGVPCGASCPQAARTYRQGLFAALGAFLLLLWIIGAVGALGVEGDPADAMYAGVFVVAVIGALIARGRPGGMARAMTAAAATVGLIATVALLLGKHEASHSSVFEVVGLNGLFAGLFLLSARFFRRAEA